MLKKDKVWFLRGLLAAFASNRQTVTYDEMRRLCRLNDELLIKYLDEAREGLGQGEPDYCSIVVKTTAVTGAGWGNPSDSPASALKTHQYWSDRRSLDNPAFQKKYSQLPTYPGLMDDEE